MEKNITQRSYDKRFDHRFANPCGGEPYPREMRNVSNVGRPPGEITPDNGSVVLSKPT